MGNCHVICTDIKTSLISLTSSTACLCCLCGDLSIFMAFFLVLSAYNPGDSRFVLFSTSENSAGYLLLYDKLNGLILCQYIVLLMNLIFGQGSVEMAHLCFTGHQLCSLTEAEVSISKWFTCMPRKLVLAVSWHLEWWSLFFYKRASPRGCWASMQHRSCTPSLMILKKSYLTLHS